MNLWVFQKATLLQTKKSKNTEATETLLMEYCCVWGQDKLENAKMVRNWKKITLGRILKQRNKKKIHCFSTFKCSKIPYFWYSHCGFGQFWTIIGRNANDKVRSDLKYCGQNLLSRTDSKIEDFIQKKVPPPKKKKKKKNTSRFLGGRGRNIKCWLTRRSLKMNVPFW